MCCFCITVQTPCRKARGTMQGWNLVHEGGCPLRTRLRSPVLSYTLHTQEMVCVRVGRLRPWRSFWPQSVSYRGGGTGVRCSSGQGAGRLACSLVPARGCGDREHHTDSTCFRVLLDVTPSSGRMDGICLSSSVFHSSLFVAPKPQTMW